MSGFVDVHAHFIYGVDDGAQTQQEMYALIDESYAQGVKTLFATSHAAPGVRPFPHEEYEARLVQAQQYCEQKGYDMAIYVGAEILASPLLAGYVASHRLPELGGTGWVLVEFLPDVSAKEVERTLDVLACVGYRVLLAHIERYTCFAHGALARRLRKEYPVRYQVNCSSVLAPGGFFSRHRLDSWLRAGFVDAVASDMHNTSHRPQQMHDAYECLAARYGGELAGRLTGLDGQLFDGEDFLF